MKRKFTCLIVSSFMVLSLVIAACAPAVVEKPEVTEKPKPEVAVETPKPEVVEPVVEKPKYGGVLNVILDSDITDFDDIVARAPHSGWTLQLTNEPLISGDWAKGPAGGYGTNETTWQERSLPVQQHLRAGYLVESWEFPKKMEGDTATLIFHIRKGVNFGLNPQSEASRLVGGREMTTEDVLYSLNLIVTDSRAYVYRVNPGLRIAKITIPAPWTVKIEGISWADYEAAVTRFGGHAHIYPREVYEKWGPTAFAEWKKSVGTGPWILTNNVVGSSAALVRNPNYWMKNPVGPGKGDQLPYMDGVKFFIIPDKSTQLAALRTGKVDVFWEKGGLEWDEGLMMMKTAPPFMIVREGLRSGSPPIHFNMVKPPFNDIRVRRAMHMAIDFETINNELYEGRGLIYSHPIVYPEDFPDVYFGPDLKTGVWPPDASEEVRELYSYNPEKAKQLLAEAGYPQGFKTHLTIVSSAEDIDYFSIYVDYWRKIGVEVELRPLESTAFDTYKIRGMNDAMVRAHSMARTRYYDLQLWMGGQTYNTMGFINEPPPAPKLREAYEKIQSVVLFDRAEADRVYRELNKYVLEQVWGIAVIARPTWQPSPVWLKNYSGERTVSGTLTKDFYRWVWIDQKLKKSLGY